MTQEALKLALEALKDVGVLTDREWQAVHKNKANELRQAIAELESQEPVCPECKAGVLYECVACSSNNYPPQRTEKEPVADDFFKMIADRNPKPFSTPQRTWVGLSDEDWKEIEDMPDTFDQGVAWAQAKLKEKNT